MLSRTCHLRIYNGAFRRSASGPAVLPRTLTTTNFHRYQRSVDATRPTMSKAETHATLSLVSTPHAPAAIGPYSQAVKVGDLVFLSGCIPLDTNGDLVGEGDIKTQATQALQNLKAVVEGAGSELGKVVKTTIFLKNMEDFAAINAIYGEFFGNHKPARSTVEVARLPRDVLFEVEAIASLA